MGKGEKTLTKNEYRTLSLAALGGALEFYDFIIFVFFAKIIGQLFFPPGIADWLKLIQAYGLFAAGYLARPFGGIVMAHFGDIVGRKRMFSLSIFLMAIPTLLIGLLPTYEHVGFLAPVLLLIMRVLQGIAVGGEVPGAWVFVSEHVPSKKVGLACGILTSGLTVGILLGSLVTTFLQKSLGADNVVAYGWRIPFVLGGIFGFIALYLRRFLEETPVFKKIKQRKAESKFPLKEVLVSHYKSIGIAMLLTWILSAGILVIILMAPEFLETQYNIARVASLEANTAAIILLSSGCVFFGWLVDKIGAGLSLLLGGLLVVISSLLFYYSVAYFQEYYFIFYCLAGFSIGLVGMFAYVMVHSFPAAVRFSGISFSFNVAYAFAGGFTPVLIIALIHFLNSKMVPGYYVACLFSCCTILGIYFLRRKEPLEKYDDVGVE